jgi:hypothetical protein
MDEADKVDPSVEVSRWLKEVGRRRSPSARPADQQPTPQVAARPRSGTLRRTLLLALLLVVSLQYLYASTTVEILSLPSIVVFIFAG